MKEISAINHVVVHSPLVTARVTQLQTQRGRSPAPHGVNLQPTTNTFNHQDTTVHQKPMLFADSYANVNTLSSPLPLTIAIQLLNETCPRGIVKR